MDPAHDTDSPFVGRERELETLASGLRDAASGRPRYFLVTVTPASARCWHHGGTDPAHAAARVAGARGRAPEQAGRAELLAVDSRPRALRRSSRRGTLREALAGDGPVSRTWCRRSGSPVPTSNPSRRGAETSRHGSRSRRGDRLPPSRGGHRSGFLLVLEDLHWADEASLALLGFVAGEVRAGRLLLVATSREREPHQRLRGFADAVRTRPARGAARARSTPPSAI